MNIPAYFQPNNLDSFTVIDVNGTANQQSTTIKLSETLKTLHVMV